MENFSKGDLIEFKVDHFDAWRRTTHEERQAWYDRLYEECRNGRDVPYDSAGESRLAPQDVDINFASNEPVMIVNRARVRAPVGYGSLPHCMEVTDPATGQTFFVRKRQVVLIKGGK